MAALEVGNVVRYVGRERRDELGGGRLYKATRVTKAGKVRAQSLDAPVRVFWADAADLDYVQASTSLGAGPRTPVASPEEAAPTGECKKRPDESDVSAAGAGGRPADMPSGPVAGATSGAPSPEATGLGPHGFAVVAFTEHAATVEGVYADCPAAEAVAASVRRVLRGLGVRGTAASMPARLVGDWPWSS